MIVCWQTEITLARQPTRGRTPDRRCCSVNAAACPMPHQAAATLQLTRCRSCRQQSALVYRAKPHCFASKRRALLRRGPTAHQSPSMRSLPDRRRVLTSPHPAITAATRSIDGLHAVAQRSAETPFSTARYAVDHEPIRQPPGTSRAFP